MKCNYGLLTPALLFIASLTACGDSRPVADAAAHVFNSSEQSVSVALTAPGSNGTSFTLAPGAGQWVPLRRADRYTVSVTEPATLGYSQIYSVSANSIQDVLFDISATGRFSLEPVVYVPRNMPSDQAQSAVESILDSGDYDSHSISRPAPMHILPTGVFYSFGDDPDSSSQQIGSSTYEVRYQLTATD